MGLTICNPCCCCCMELRTGCFLIGFIDLVVEIIGIIFTVSIMISGGERAGSLGYLLLLPLVLAFFFAIILLVGLYENKPNHVKAYIWCALVKCWIAAAFCWNIVGKTGNPVSISVGVITLIMQSYFLVVVKCQVFSMAEPPAAISPA